MLVSRPAVTDSHGGNTNRKHNMPKKNAIPSETLQILESLWAQGMQNCSTHENKLKIQQAALVTGLVDEKIKCWIYNRNRKKKKDDDDGGQSKENKSFSTSTKEETCTEDITTSVFEKLNQEVTEEVDSECSRLSQGEPYQDSSSDEESQQGTAARLLRGLEEKVQELQECDCDIIVLVYNHNSRYLSTTGTPRGLDFLRSQDPGIDFQFAAALSASS